MVHVAEKRKESEEVVIRASCQMNCGCTVLRMCCVDKWWKSLYASHPTDETDWSTAAFESVYRSKRTAVVRPTCFFFSFFSSPIVLRRYPLKTVFRRVGPWGASAPWAKHEPIVTESSHKRSFRTRGKQTCLLTPRAEAPPPWCYSYLFEKEEIKTVA